MAKLASSSTFALDFLRRLLCAHSASSSADDRCGSAAAAARHTCTPETEEPPRSPCIVARLMGLDAMPPPETPHAQLQSQQRTPPLRRSRSASSAEGSPSPWEWDRDTQPQPRVVRASASMRERPAYLRQESDEFLLLSFSPEEPADPDRERHVKEELEFLLATTDATATRRAGAGRVGLGSDAPGSKQRRNGRCRRLRFADDEAESESQSPGLVLLLRRRRTTPAAAECDAHHSSPVSVLEAHDESSTTTTTTTSSSLEEVDHAEPCSATSDESQTSTLEQQNSKRNLHPDFFQLDNLSPPRSSCHVSRCSDRERRRNRRVVNKNEVITPEVSGIWQPICRLVEKDLKNMQWTARDGADVVVAEIEYGVLEYLMCEMVDELFFRGMSETVQHPFPLPSSISKKQLGGKSVHTRRSIGCY